MRSLVALLCVFELACHPRASMPSTREEREGPCLGFSETAVRHRTEGGFIVIEARTARQEGCEGPPVTSVTELARIEVPPAPDACPVGQVALASGDHFERDELPPFVATLAKEPLAEVRDALQQFAEGTRGGAAEAFVVGCAGQLADWLFVQTVHHGEGGPQVALFEEGVLRPKQHAQPLVVPYRARPPRATAPPAMVSPATDVAPGAPEPAAVTPSPPLDASKRMPGDCSEKPGPGEARWVGRQFWTGRMPGPDRLATYLLVRSGPRVSVVIQERSAQKHPVPAGWRCDGSTTLSGSSATRGGKLVLSLAEPAAPAEFHEVVCARRTVAIAAASAVRVPIPSKMEGCKAHRWRPAAGEKRTVLSCRANDPSWPRFMGETLLGEAPGVEHVTIDEDDCGDPVLALRALTAGEEPAPVLAPVK